MTNYIYIIVGITVILLFIAAAGGVARPLKWMGTLAVRLTVGALLLFFLNIIGESFNMHVPINLVTTAVSGLLGLPGIAALIIIKFSIGV